MFTIEMLNLMWTGLLETLEEMGAAVTRAAVSEIGGEPACDLHVAAGPLRGVDVPAARVPAMIDEFPILAVAAACAHGTTRMRDLGELQIYPGHDMQALPAPEQYYGAAAFQGLADRAREADKTQLARIEK